jgi:hypothetical protein
MSSPLATLYMLGCVSLLKPFLLKFNSDLCFRKNCNVDAYRPHSPSHFVRPPWLNSVCIYCLYFICFNLVFRILFSLPLTFRSALLLIACNHQKYIYIYIYIYSSTYVAWRRESNCGRTLITKSEVVRFCQEAYSRRIGDQRWFR